jgi:hypothetical protein
VSMGGNMKQFISDPPELMGCEGGGGPICTRSVGRHLG